MCVTRIVGHKFILLFPQPVYRQQMETATRFVHLEREVSQLRGALEQSKSKYPLSGLFEISSTVCNSELLLGCSAEDNQG